MGPCSLAGLFLEPPLSIEHNRTMTTMIMIYDSPELLLISSNIFYWPWKTWKQSRTEHVPMWHSPPSMVNLTYPASSETWPNLLIKCGHWTSSINMYKCYKWCFYWCFDGNIIYNSILFFRWHPAMFDAALLRGFVHLRAVLRGPPLCFQTGRCRKRSDSSRYSPPHLREPRQRVVSEMCTSKRKNSDGFTDFC